MKTFLVLSALLVFAIACPILSLPTVQVIVNIDTTSQESSVVEAPSVVGPQPVLPEYPEIIPAPVQLPEPVFPELLQPVEPEVTAPAKPEAAAPEVPEVAAPVEPEVAVPEQPESVAPIEPEAVGEEVILLPQN